MYETMAYKLQGDPTYWLETCREVAKTHDGAVAHQVAYSMDVLETAYTEIIDFARKYGQFLESPDNSGLRHGLQDMLNRTPIGHLHLLEDAAIGN